MKKSSVIKFFGDTKQTAEALDISRQAVEKWPDLVPMLRAYQIEVVTKGALKVRKYLYA